MSLLAWLSSEIGAEAPKLAVIGGRLEDSNAPIYEEMHRLAGGRILVFATASSEPDIVGPEAVEVFRGFGFDAALAPVHGPGAAQSAHDPAVVALVQDYRSVYFTGGNQAHIIHALAPDRQETPVLTAIRAAHASGGLVAGSSAGAAMMSETMIVGGTSLDGTIHGVTAVPERPGMLLDTGLGFFRWGMVDQHFIKRGRLGRMVVAMAASGDRHGFGVDENTALFVDGTRAWVIGEYGVFVLDMTRAQFDPRGRTFQDIKFTYLDDGDAYDLSRNRALPGATKRRVRPSEIAYRAPSRSKRNVFGAYTLYDLLARLVLGDSHVYASDRASAVEPKAGMSVTVEIERLRGISRGLIAVQETGLRMTAINFRATVMVARLSAARLASRGTRPLRDSAAKPVAGSRIILLGSSPLQEGSTLLAEIARRCEGPVGIIAAASSEPRTTAKNHANALKALGLEVVDFGITIDTVERIGRNAAVVEQIAGLRTIFIPGGNQIRLVETLLHRGEETPILKAIERAYAAGGTLIGASGAASALCGFMVAGGSSYEALRFGVSSDTGHKGLVIQEGVGLFGAGIVDQNMFTSRRVGRLIVACAEEGVRFGFGICEDSMMIATAERDIFEVVGGRGVVLVEIDQTDMVLHSDCFVARGTRLSFALPGDRIDSKEGLVLRDTPPETAAAALDLLMTELARDCGVSFGLGGRSPRQKVSPITMQFVSHGDGTGVFDLECARGDRS